jgi:hypothetical protein
MPESSYNQQSGQGVSTISMVTSSHMLDIPRAISTPKPVQPPLPSLKV